MMEVSACSRLEKPRTSVFCDKLRIVESEKFSNVGFLREVNQAFELGKTSQVRDPGPQGS